MFSPVEEIKSRIDVVELIQSYIKVQKAGMNYKAICPFHAEKTPSFFISPARQIWHCFGGCGEGGDIFKFVMKLEGLEFPEALRLLAQRAGVMLKREDPAARSERNRLHDICEEAALVFERVLGNTPAAKSYLRTRGVSEDTIKEFRIGFAPQSWDFLLKQLLQKKFSREEIERAGLAIRSQDNFSWYDRFRGRIIFPITDSAGRVIGFGGRVFSVEDGKPSSPEKVEAKYINTPQTPIYDKSRVLYGFDRAKHEIRAKNQVVVVEGYMDCVMSHQAGVKNTISVSGTALTFQQLQIVKRLCDTLICSFDADQAGDSATKRSLALAAQFELKRKIAVIPSGKDPADAVKENPAIWRKAVFSAKDIATFYFDKLFNEHDPRTVEGKKQITERLLPVIFELSDEIEKAHWVGEIAKRFSIQEDTIWKELTRRGGADDVVSQVHTAEASVLAIPTRRELLEERLLILLSVVRDEVRSRELTGHYLEFTHPLYKNLFDYFTKDELGRHAAPLIQEHIATLKFKGEMLGEITKDIDRELMVCIRELEKVSIRERLLRLGEEIDRREREGGVVLVGELLQNFRTLSDKLKLLS